MKTKSQSKTAANPQKSADPEQAHLVCATPLFEKRAYIRKVDRYWIPNHHTRATVCLSANKALDLVDAAMHAIIIRLPLNLSVTIRLKQSIIMNPNHRPQDVISAFLKRAVQWLRKRGVPGTYIWVLEHAEGTGGDVHVHVLIHCPQEDQAAFKKMAKTNWLRMAGLDTREKGTILCKSFGPRGYDLIKSNERDHKQYQNQLAGSLRYHLKGIDPEEVLPNLTECDHSVAKALCIRSQNNHPIYGRRASRSENISESARDRYAKSLPQPISNLSKLL
jgi:hypothetical protein